MNKLKKWYSSLVLDLRYITSIKFIKKTYQLGYHIMSIGDTIDFIAKPGNSMVRFGDGEIDLINGTEIKGYQKNNPALAKRLEDAAFFYDEKMLVCFPDSLVCLNDKKEKTKKHWAYSFRKHYDTYKCLCRTDYCYGNSFVSRPYIVYKDVHNVHAFFEKLINIFKDRDIVLVEGEYSRSGVGNDLFSKAKSVKRILCPANNAFEKYEEILATASKVSKTALVLVALGPTAKPLCVDLFCMGFWVLDIGHIDSEYEWFLKKSTQKVALGIKHTAECSDDFIPECTDEEYLQSIIAHIK